MNKHYIPSENRVPFKFFFTLKPIRGSLLEGSAAALHGKVCHSKDARSALFTLFNQWVEPGYHEILLPAYTCESVVEAALAVTECLTFYDLNENNLESSYEQIESRISAKTKVLLVQHLFGKRTSLSFLTAIRQKHPELIIIEDSSQYFSLDQQLQADYLVWSFGRGKPFPIGFGGAVVASEKSIQAFEHSSTKKLSFIVPNLVTLLSQFLSKPLIYRFIDPLITRKSGKNQSVVYSNDKSQYQLGESKAHQAFMNRFYRFLPVINDHRSKISKIYNDLLGKNFGYEHYENVACIRYPIRVENPIEVSLALRYLGVRKMYIDHSRNLGVTELTGSKSIEEELITLPTTLQITEKRAVKIANEVIKHAQIVIV